MRLLNTLTLEFEEVLDSNTPSYAILSHTWGKEEVSFQDMTDGHRDKHHPKAGYQKVSQFCALADQRGYKYGWVDSCCIDKKSSAELSEAINSMYRYYNEADECFVYLSDVRGSSDRISQWQEVRGSRWFTRGWTLQELIAPKSRLFLADDWSPIEYQDTEDFLKTLAQTTSIDYHLLVDGTRLDRYCIAERMSWASKRQTTRSEDRAYSLMGLFNINMPVIYGEGQYKAFKRLQYEIMQIAFDHTIFAWRGDYRHSGLFATSPSDFDSTPLLGLWDPQRLTSYSITNVGILVKVLVIERHRTTISPLTTSSTVESESLAVALQCDIKVGTEPNGRPLWRMLVIYIMSVPGVSTRVGGQSYQAYRRVKCAEWTSASATPTSHHKVLQILMLENEHYISATNVVHEGWSRWNSDYRMI